MDDTPYSARVKMFAAICPPLYRESDQARFPVYTEKILSWTFNPTGLFIQGPSRTFKTRAAWALVRRHFFTGHSVLYFDGVGWGIECAKAFSDCERSEAYLAKWVKPDILFIDDLFKSRVTEAVESGLYALLERRAGWLKPCIITSNAGGHVMKALMTDAGQLDRYTAIIERIKEFSQVVVCKSGGGLTVDTPNDRASVMVAGSGVPASNQQQKERISNDISH